MANEPYTEVWNINQIDRFTYPRDVHEADGYVYIGRADQGTIHMGNCSPGVMGWLGNPYTVDQHGRDRCIELFRRDFYDRLRRDDWFRRSVLALSGKKLVCWCKPDPCHGDVIAEYLNNSLSDIGSIDVAGDTAD